MSLKFKLLDVPREFFVNGFKTIDHGKVELVADDAKTNEFISFKTQSGKECDFYATSWGFYLGPSLNSRLVNQGFKVGLTVNENNQIYSVAVENEKIDQFMDYLKVNNTKLICWLSDWFNQEK